MTLYLCCCACMQVYLYDKFCKGNQKSLGIHNFDGCFHIHKRYQFKSWPAVGKSACFHTPSYEKVHSESFSFNFYAV